MARSLLPWLVCAVVGHDRGVVANIPRSRYTGRRLRYTPIYTGPCRRCGEQFGGGWSCQEANCWIPAVDGSPYCETHADGSKTYPQDHESLSGEPRSMADVAQNPVFIDSTDDIIGQPPADDPHEQYHRVRASVGEHLGIPADDPTHGMSPLEMATSLLSFLAQTEGDTPIGQACEERLNLMKLATEKADDPAQPDVLRVRWETAKKIKPHAKPPKSHLDKEAILIHHGDALARELEAERAKAERWGELLREYETGEVKLAEHHARKRKEAEQRAEDFQLLYQTTLDQAEAAESELENATLRATANWELYKTAESALEVAERIIREHLPEYHRLEKFSERVAWVNEALAEIAAAREGGRG